MTELMAILINDLDYTKAEAQEAIADARKRVLDGENPEEILEEEFGLEPDYVLDLL